MGDPLRCGEIMPSTLNHSRWPSRFIITSADAAGQISAGTVNQSHHRWFNQTDPAGGGAFTAAARCHHSPPPPIHQGRFIDWPRVGECNPPLCVFVCVFVSNGSKVKLPPSIPRWFASIQLTCHQTHEKKKIHCSPLCSSQSAIASIFHWIFGAVSTALCSVSSLRRRPPSPFSARPSPGHRPAIARHRPSPPGHRPPAPVSARHHPSSPAIARLRPAITWPSLGIARHLHHRRWPSSPEIPSLPDIIWSIYN